VEGLSAQEAAQVIGIDVGALKSRLHRARMAVRARLAPHLGLAAEGAATPSCRDVVEIFSRRLEGEIDGSACAELEGHLETCPTCRGRCDTLRATLTMCRRAGEAPVPPSVERQVRVALQQFLDQR